MLQALQNWLWQPKAPEKHRLARQTGRFLFVMGRDLAGGQLTLRAMSLVYTTLLSFVPLLALTFSLLKGFDVHQQAMPHLEQVFIGLGSQGKELAQQVIGFVERMQVGVLGTLGLATLLYTVISLLQKIEGSINYIWHVSAGRSLARRFSDYLSVLLVGPLLLVTAMSLTASASSNSLMQQLTQIQPFGELMVMIGRISPYLLVTAVFSFLYVFLPNTKVKLLSAMVGGLVAGIGWQSAGWAFATFVASSGQYQAVYSGFAVIMLLFIWLYVGWLIVLIGASVAYYHQHPEQIRRLRENPKTGHRLREALVLQCMYWLAERFQHGQSSTQHELELAAKAPYGLVPELLVQLEHAKLIRQTDEQPPQLIPARGLESICIQEILEAVRQTPSVTLVQAEMAEGADKLLQCERLANANTLKQNLSDWLKERQ